MSVTPQLSQPCLMHACSLVCPDSTVPDSAKLDPAPPPLPPPPHSKPTAVPIAPPSSGNGKRAPSGGQSQTAQQLQTPLQQRYPPREVPPRFRQQEHKQLLKRGQPLPPGTLPLTATGHPTTTEPAAAVAVHSSTSCSAPCTASLPTGQPRHSVGRLLCLQPYSSCTKLYVSQALVPSGVIEFLEFYC